MTVSGNHKPASMENILENEISVTLQLIESLSVERESILEGDAASLECAVQTKEDRLEQLSDLERQRIKCMQEAGYKASPDGMLLYLNQHKQTDDIHSLWQHLLTLAAEVREQNRENHQLVKMYSHHARQTLCILRGEDPNQEVYEPGGSTRAHHHERRSLAKA